MFAICYLLVMVISLVIFAFIDLNLNKKILIAALLFAIFALIIIPKDNGTVDATKYFSFLENIRHARQEGGQIMAWQMVNNNTMTLNLKPSGMAVPDALSFGATPVMGLIMLIMSYFPNELLMALVTFADYFFAMKIIQIVVEKNKLSKWYFCCTYLIFCCLFAYSVAVGGIRNNFVGTAFAYAALRYLEKKKPFFSWATIELFAVTLLLSLIHQFTLILFALFFLVVVFNRYKIIMRILDIMMFGQSIFQDFFLSLIGPLGGIPFFASILFKSNQYLGNNATIHISSTANLVRDVARLVILLLIFLVVRKFSSDLIDLRYIEFIILLFCFIIGSFKDQLLFERCLLVMLPIMLPYITILLVAVRHYDLRNPESARAVALNLSLIFLFLFAIICLSDNLRAGSTYYYFLWS